MKRRISIAILVIMLVHTMTFVMAEGETTAEKLLPPPVIAAESAILVDQDSGKILYAKDEHKKMYPASTTKILTAMLAIENLDMEQVVQVGDEANMVEKDGSGAGLFWKQDILCRNLIWALMLPSGNDAAFVIAVQVAKKKNNNPNMAITDAVAYFVTMMNEKLADIGAKESHFANPDGYHDDNHYTTAYDMALIAENAMKNAFFREVVKTYDHTAQGPSGQSTNVEADWINKNELVNKQNRYYTDFATGIKTGHTTPAGYCLVSSGSKDNMNVISVVFKGASEDERAKESKMLLEYGVNGFSSFTFAKTSEVAIKAKVVRSFSSKTISLDVKPAKGLTELISKSDIAAIKKNITWDPKVLDTKNKGKEIQLNSPISKGQVLGKMTYTLAGKVLFETNLIAGNDAKVSDFLAAFVGFVNSFWLIMLIVVGFAAVVLLIIALLRKRARRKYYY